MKFKIKFLESYFWAKWSNRDLFDTTEKLDKI